MKKRDPKTTFHIHTDTENPFFQTPRQIQLHKHSKNSPKRHKLKREKRVPKETNTSLEYKLRLTKRWEYHSRSEATCPVKREIKPRKNNIKPQRTDREIGLFCDLQHTCLCCCSKGSFVENVLNLQALATPISSQPPPRPPPPISSHFLQTAPNAAINPHIQGQTLIYFGGSLKP